MTSSCEMTTAASCPVIAKTISSTRKLFQQHTVDKFLAHVTVTTVTMKVLGHALRARVTMSRLTFALCNYHFVCVHTRVYSLMSLMTYSSTPARRS